MFDLPTLKTIATDLLVPGVPVLEKMVRPLLVYIFLVTALRLFGKRELAQLNPFDLIVLLLLSNTVQNAIIGNDNSLSGGFIGAGMLLITNFFVVKYVRHNQRFDRLAEGEPTQLVEDGKILPDGLREELITEQDLLAVVRRQGFSTIAEIDSCALQPNGTFAISPKKKTEKEVSNAAILSELSELKKQIGALSAELRKQH